LQTLRKQVGADLDEIEVAFAAGDFFIREIVVHVGEMDVRDFVARERVGDQTIGNKR